MAYRNAMKIPILIAVFAAWFLGGCSPDLPEQISFTIEPAQIERGAELARGLAACGVCHGEGATPDAPLSGGRAYVDRYGAVLASNITPASSGLEGWRAGEIVRVLRGGPRRDDTALSTEVHKGFEWMSDADTLAVVSFLLTVPPVENAVARRDISFVDRNTRGFFDVQREVRGFVPEIEPRFAVQYGRYLTDHVARCGFCHHRPPGLLGGEEYLGGGRTVSIGGVESVAPNITAAPGVGIGDWSQLDLVSYLRTGATPSGDVSAPRLCPTDFYRNASSEDLTSIALYLKSITP
jgi:mono/diheme cytochrome c family protein